MAKDDRLRQPMDAGYAEAIGRAIYCFTVLEWNAVYCGQKLEPGYVATVDRLMSGRIARQLTAKSEALDADLPYKKPLVAALTEFARLVERRNDVIHTHPGTAPDSAQQMFRFGEAWTIENLQKIADEFSAASIILNDLYHNHLP